MSTGTRWGVCLVFVFFVFLMITPSAGDIYNARRKTMVACRKVAVNFFCDVEIEI